MVKKITNENLIAELDSFKKRITEHILRQPTRKPRKSWSKILSDGYRTSWQRLFNFGHEEFLNMLHAQKGVCAVCVQPERSIKPDRDRVTGRIRGLLCVSCNNGVSRFRDDVRLLKQAIIYLEKV